MIIAADYPFVDILWSMGWAKAGWVVFMLALPFLGVLVYLIVNHDGMAERSAKAAQDQKEQFDDYVRSVGGGGGAASQIDKGKQLLDGGAITPDDFAALKAEALAT